MSDFDTEQYHRAKLALLTGWTFDTIDNLGALDDSIVMQVYEAEQALKGR